MKLSWNQKIFLQLNQKLGKRPGVDRIMHWCAFWLPWVMAVGFLAILWRAFFLSPGYFSFLLRVSVFSFVLAYIVSYSIAIVFKHKRPIKELPSVKELFTTLGTWKSFPSDHTIAVTLLAFLVGFSTDSLWFFGFYAALALVVGFARVYAGVHYPRDIIGGIVVGVGAFYTVVLSLLRLFPSLLF